MRRFTTFATALLVTMAFVYAAPAFADENEVVALRNQVKDLNAKLEALESRLEGVQSEVRAAKPGIEHPGHATPVPGGEGGLLRASQNIDIGGYVETQWNNNFHQPVGGAASTSEGTNRLRVFDTDDGSFTVNSAELTFEKPAEQPKEAGFRVDIQMGEDADVVNADGDGVPGAAVGNDAKFDLQQAYIEYIAPLSFFESSEILPHSVKIKAGRFVTLAGAEVIEGPDNWNISRSLDFGFGIPFAHTGLRANFGLWQDKFDVYVGINNGWDDPVDVNSDKTLEFGLGYQILDNVKAFHAIYHGAEGVPGAANRFLSSNVITWDVSDKFSVMGAIDLAREGNVDINEQDAKWYDFAAYARYQFTEKFAMAYRAELFVDDMSFRTSTTAGVAPLGPGSDRTWGQTFTAEYRLTENLITRGEFRFDKSEDDTLISSESSQPTIGAQVIYLI